MNALLNAAIRDDSPLLINDDNCEFSHCPIVMIDCSGSTQRQFNEKQNVYQIIQQKALDILKQRDITEAKFIFWSSSAKAILTPLQLGKDDIHSIFVDNFIGCGTKLSRAFKAIPDEWREDKQDIYIFTDGEISDRSTKLLSTLNSYLDLNNSIYIFTVEANDQDYLTGNCRAGNLLYDAIKENGFTHHVKGFNCFNRKHYEQSFQNLYNPVIPEGYAPFENKVFKTSRLPEFIGMLEQRITDSSKDELVKLLYALSFTLFHLFRKQTTLINESLLSLIVGLFSECDLEDVRGELENGINKHRQGRSTTFQEYRNNRQMLFERTQEGLYENVKSNITIDDCPLYVSPPLLVNGQLSLITCGEEDVNATVKLGFNEYQNGGVKIDGHIIPVLPGNFRYMENKEVNQSVRQWVRAILSSKYRRSGSSDFLQYRWLTDALAVYLSDQVTDEVKESFRAISLVMLSRVRYGTKDRELWYLAKGNPPETVVNNDSFETIESIFDQCISQSGLNVQRYTLWYGIICMLKYENLVETQLPFCKASIKIDFPELEPDFNGPDFSSSFLDKLKERVADTSSMTLRVCPFSMSGLNDNLVEYTCFVTQEDTSQTGGYKISRHHLTKKVVCNPKYVMTKESYEDFVSNLKYLKCPICRQAIDREQIVEVPPKPEMTYCWDSNLKITTECFSEQSQISLTELDLVLTSDRILDGDSLQSPSPLLDIDEIGLSKCSYRHVKDVPIITHKMNKTGLVHLTSNKEFVEAVEKRFPFLKGVQFDNLVIAGGFCRSILLEQPVADIDFFLHGISDNTEFLKRVERLVSNLKKNIEEIYPGMECLLLYKSNNNVLELIYLKPKANMVPKPFDDFKDPKEFEDLEDPDDGDEEEEEEEVEEESLETLADCFEQYVKIQIILVKHDKIENILNRFDMYASQVAFDGSTVLFNKLSCLAYKYMINTVNPSRHHSSYDYRLTKYFHAGFDLLVPELDTSMIKTGLMQLSKLNFVVDKVVDNKVIVSDMTLSQLTSAKRDLDDEGRSLYHSLSADNLTSTTKYIESVNRDSTTIYYSKLSEIPKLDSIVLFDNGSTVIEVECSYPSHEEVDWYGQFKKI